MALLEVEKLDVTYATRSRRPLQAVRDVTFRLDAGDLAGLAGESGSGKSTLGNAILRLLQPPGVISGGSVRFDGQDLLSARLLSDEILVLNQGRVVEQGPAKQVIRSPRDAYTRQLLEAIPTLDYHVDARSGYVPAEEAATAAQ